MKNLMPFIYSMLIFIIPMCYDFIIGLIVLTVELVLLILFLLFLHYSNKRFDELNNKI